ncbi:MAG: histidine kinase [Solirubrobacterales bacterium]|nr:histidine kinase [Solirubrobacterales bacterium]
MSTIAAVTAAELRIVDLFDGLDDAQLEPWVAAATVAEFEAGDTVIEPNALAGVQLLLAGTGQLQAVSNGTTDMISRQVAPTWIGAVASLTRSPLGVRMEALEHCRLATIGVDDFERLVLSEPIVHGRIMRQVRPVLGTLMGREQSQAHLAALGTMAAGLAHELNNPAAASKRAAAQMGEALDTLAQTIGRFVEMGLEREDAGRLVELQQEALARAGACTIMDQLDVADREDELSDRLEAIGVREPWEVAAPLAAARLDIEWVDRVVAATGAAAPAAIEWIATHLTARGLAQELQESSERMSSLVGAIKSYSYMDRGETQEIDIHEGLETTIVVLGHKLKQTTIELVRDYDRSLPKLMVHGSELNQVWTNLLDNAIDALDGSGTITLRTRPDGRCVLVEIADDGPGIPSEALAKVFDPFFTTKDVGQGTGLGLDAARRIIVDRHGGSLTVDSRPGSTTFHVWIPYTESEPPAR